MQPHGSHSISKQRSKMQNIYDYTLRQLEGLLEPSFRAKQIYHWLYVQYAQDFDVMHNLPKALKNKLSKDYRIKHLEIMKVETSCDGTKKYLFKTLDGHTFESVLIKMREEKIDCEGRIIHGSRYTFCVSSQIGCKVGCAFCFTAKGGFVRNLSSGEIVEQVLQLKKDNSLAPEKRVNIVFMGMGEPLNNLENVAQAIRIMSELDGLSISPRRQTISTSGIAPKIAKLGELDLGVQLAISLHAVDDELRSRLIPMNKAYNIKSIIDAVRQFPVDTRKKVMFEYLVIKDVNDDLKSAKILLKLLDGIRAKVNLILFNPHEGSEFQRPEMEQVKKFADFLVQRGLLATIRESRGIDISAACGQLREKETKVSCETSKAEGMH
ncbi:23S rRNA (adenine(2503)-C(2))-methyltransferase RlmN [Helicobacter mustelae]|uniref:Probable dual-specificity RNA methyltransferase RlmN n=2 Tax=Helicobacter mustelae TaxID=217 RepID=D3UFN4_HELM1|nr:23S rRNA (adenine(2503)-C(2))-methyltransferase RlmN [Helicobacter mustelae]CBG39305.1 Putative radical-SAM-proteins [Helicobacter mustelae 12198]